MMMKLILVLVCLKQVSCESSKIKFLFKITSLLFFFSDKNSEQAIEDNDVGIEGNFESEESIESLSSAPKAGEIKEIQDTQLPEETCIACKTVRLCKYKVFHEDDIKFICEYDCIDAFRTSNSEQTFKLSQKRIVVTLIPDLEKQCIGCEESKLCRYRIPTADETVFDYVCEDNCLQKFIGRNVERYIVRKKRFLIEEFAESKELFKCYQCFDDKVSRFKFTHDNEEQYLCEEICLNLLLKEQPDRFRLKRKSVRVRDLPKRAGLGSATIPMEPDPPATEQPKMLARTESEAIAAREDREASFIRRCAQCFSVVLLNDRSLNWETMDFCNETCLGSYQNVIGAACTSCQNAVTMASLGKYCVRFGYEIRQFCRSACLDAFKKGLKVCSYCQKDISKNTDGFLASVAGQFKDFCTSNCMKKYDELCNPKKRITAGICSVCNNVDQIRVEIFVDGRDHSFCSSPCFSAFKFVNNIESGK